MPLPSSHSTVIQLEAGRPVNLVVMALALQPVGQVSGARIIEAVEFALGLVLLVFVVVVVVAVFTPTIAFVCCSNCIGRIVVCKVTPSVTGSENAELTPHTLPAAGLAAPVLPMLALAPRPALLDRFQITQ